MLKNKIKLFSTGILFTPIVVISCSNNSKTEIEKDNKYIENNNFTNKIDLSLGNNNKEVEINTPKLNNYKAYINPIFKIFSGEKILNNQLPSNIKFFTEDNNERFFSVNWNHDDLKVFYNDSKIFGTVIINNEEVKVFAKVYTQDKKKIVESDYVVKEDNWSIDIEKSTHDGGIPNLSKLIDRNGNYVDSGSRWDNWGTFGKDQNNNLVFHWQNKEIISRLELIFWKYASNGNSSGKLPKKIFVQHSEDGINWTNVNNQDKITDEELGPMGTYNNRLINISDVKRINFSPIKTNWIRINWEAAVNSNNQKHIIGITNVSFKGTTFEDKLIINKNNNINEVIIDENTYKIDFQNKETTINIDDINKKIMFSSKATFINTFITEETNEHKKYLIISYNDIGDYKIHNLILVKNKQK
ncbi:Uncharacterised protein [Mycoplasmopsis maculosa]|uniref:F5/8 type C domain-containing protein n=1 Tax=Mycoplasmopsis maculosa TaxID=114885 RepID=A0A449B4A8_9BACT|nr:hypothetical protein [Mycoplasmopsis maculosa]VEU75420.1 Uncharacterised protein [Mycoplasmopsis maculosa]